MDKLRAAQPQRMFTFTDTATDAAKPTPAAESTGWNLKPMFRTCFRHFALAWMPLMLLIRRPRCSLSCRCGRSLSVLVIGFLMIYWTLRPDPLRRILQLGIAATISGMIQDQFRRSGSVSNTSRSPHPRIED